MFEHRTEPPHRRANSAVGMLASVGQVEKIRDSDAVRRRWDDRFRKFDKDLVAGAARDLIPRLRDAGYFEHGIALDTPSYRVRV